MCLCTGMVLDGPRQEKEHETSPPPPASSQLHLSPLKPTHKGISPVVTVSEAKPLTQSSDVQRKKCTCGKCSRCIPSPSGKYMYYNVMYIILWSSFQIGSGMEQILYKSVQENGNW